MGLCTDKDMLMVKNIYALSENYDDLKSNKLDENVPEIHLWFACLEQGIRRALIKDYGSIKRDFWWAMLDDSQEVGSFIWICHHLGMDDVVLRKKLFEVISSQQVPLSNEVLAFKRSIDAQKATL